MLSDSDLLTEKSDKESESEQVTATIKEAAKPTNPRSRRRSRSRSRDRHRGPCTREASASEVALLKRQLESTMAILCAMQSRLNYLWEHRHSQTPP